MAVSMAPLARRRQIRSGSYATKSSGESKPDRGREFGMGSIMSHESVARLLETGGPEPMKNCRHYKPEASLRIIMALLIMLSTEEEVSGGVANGNRLSF
jgi:hypothetical protein